MIQLFTFAATNVFVNMNQRLQEFLLAENISQSQFADNIGVARASISHIISGRNKPGFDFIVSMSRRYPNLNLEWLINGEGEMYKNQDVTDSSTNASAPSQGARVSPSNSKDLLQRSPAPISESQARITPSATPAPVHASEILSIPTSTPEAPSTEGMTPFEALPGPDAVSYRSGSSRRLKIPETTPPDQDDDLFSSFYEEQTTSPRNQPASSGSPNASRPSPFRKAAHYDQPRPQKTVEQPASPQRSSFADSRNSRNISRIIVLFSDGTFQELK